MQGNNKKRSRGLADLSSSALTIFALVTLLAVSSFAPLRSVTLCFTDREQKSTVARRPQDDAFLEDLSKRAFLYFWEQADPQTGLVLDRSQTDGSPSDKAH